MRCTGSAAAARSGGPGVITPADVVWPTDTVVNMSTEMGLGVRGISGK